MIIYIYTHTRARARARAYTPILKNTSAATLISII